VKKILSSSLALSLFALSASSVFAAPKVVVTKPLPSPVVSPSPSLAPVPVTPPATSSTQNTVFFVIVAVLLVAIIWYILGMPDEDEQAEVKEVKPQAKPSPKSKSKKK
jgi:hypothetical protein